jgi:predicted secreted protein
MTLIPRPWMAVLACACATGPVVAQTGLPAAPPASGVLSLSTSATVEVTKDVLNIAFSTLREGNDAQAVQSSLKQALDAALAEARRVAQPGQVDVHTGNFALYPRYGNVPPRGGQPPVTGWQGSAELIVQGRDAAAIAQLAGRINTMTIARVGYTLSREAREKVEAEASAQAIARWRAKAQQMSQQFGYAAYVVREVNVSTNDVGRPVPMVMMRAQAAAPVAEEALPTEAGRAEVTAVVNGSAQMTR